MRRGRAPTGEVWVLYGSRSSYAAEVAEIVWRRGGRVGRLVDNLPDGPALSILGPVIAPHELDDADRQLPTVVPLVTPGHRRAVQAEARTHGIGDFRALIDPTAVIARTAVLGEGTIVNAGTVVGAVTEIGRFVHINRSASVGHHAVLQDFVTLGPASVLAGHVTIEAGAFLGAGAVVAPELTIGANAIVGAGAVVIADVPAGATVVGNPARLIRQSEVGYGGVAVPASPAPR